MATSQEEFNKLFRETMTYLIYCDQYSAEEREIIKKSLLEDTEERPTRS